MDFDDDYPSCKETYVTFRAFSKTLIADEISNVIKLKPTECFSRGDLFGKSNHVRTQTGWLLSSRNMVTSLDSRRHIAWIIERLKEQAVALDFLRGQGVEMDICCYYLSEGQGGPTMSFEHMKELGALCLDIWWDIYQYIPGDLTSSCSIEI
ncbi:DUF4279 domain-containing protein [Acidovorax sp. FG27]|uniref:DUF4279 domain-containing protein n=1 Tax=Acidovorax sp. FG27 TaxID=3133652 RepID=UPI0030E8CA03